METPFIRDFVWHDKEGLSQIYSEEEITRELPRIPTALDAAAKNLGDHCKFLLDTHHRFQLMSSVVGPAAQPS